MKIVFEDGDEVVYKGERCIVKGNVKQLNGLDGIHVLKPNNDIVFTPTVGVKSYDVWLLEKCIECLNAYEKWEADLTTNDEDDLLESLSTENYDMLIRLQEMRNNIGRAISTRNKGKN